MAFDDPIVWIIILFFFILIPVAVIYLLYRLAKFLIKVNRFMDEQMKKKNDIQSQKTEP
jgi:hypothetical protein